MRRAGHLALRTGLALLAAAIVVRLLAPSPIQRPLAPAPVRIGAAVTAIGLEGGGALFDTGGREAAVPAVPDQGAPRLVGIVGRIGAADAMVRLADGSLRTMRPGDRAGAWRLAEIAPDRVRFVAGGQQQVSVLPTATDEVPATPDQ